MTHRGRFSRISIAIGLSALIAGCGDGDATPYALTQIRDGSYVLETRPCAETGDATVVETASEVRIADITRGDAIDGDCNGSVAIELDMPIGDRDLFVNGEPWIRIDDECERTMHASADRSNDRPQPTPVPCSF